MALTNHHAQTDQGLKILGQMKPGYEEILTPEALALLTDVHRRFEAERRRLLAERLERQKRLDAGAERLGFPEET
ncbi:MAG: malate synthase A, partial [Oceanicaulis sp.]